jgi:hypothetical protein
MAVRCIILLLLAALAAPAADVTGSWQFQVNTQAGSGEPTFVFEQKGEELTGTYQGALGEAKLKGTVKGDKIEFAFEISAGGQSMKVAYSGVIESTTKMKGTARYDQLGDATWEATKK